MASSKMMSGTPVLMGNNKVPGLQIPQEVRDLIPTIMKAVRDFGCDFYPSIIEFLPYDVISEIAAYNGFPVRYPHWRFGMEYEELSKGYEFGKHRIYEMIINCLDPLAPVLTKRGTVQAASVVVGDQVVLGENTRNVVAVVEQPKSKTKIISLKQGQEITCSHQHRWKVLGENGLIWKKAKDLVPGDVLVGSDSFDMSWEPPAIDWTKDNVWNATRPNVRYQLKPISTPEVLTSELCELLGAMIGNGTNGGKGYENHAFVTVGKHNRPYAERIAKLFKTVFGVNAEIIEKRRGLIVLLSSKYVVDFFDSIGLKKGCTYKTKRVPWIIWRADPKYRAKFLRGVFDTDGYASTNLGMSCYNRNLGNDLQVMMTEIGIQTVIDTRKNGVGKNGDKKYITVLQVRGKPSLQKFLDRIGFSIDYKRDGLKKLLNTAACANRGTQVPFVQESLLNWAKDQHITSHTCPSLDSSLRLFSRRLVGKNALVSFMDRASSLGRAIPDGLREVVEMPMFEVERVCDGKASKTIDIALDHDEHDFIAYGLVTHNTDPSIMYCLDSNTLVDNVTVIAHALGHSDFFKNNIHFKPTNTHMVDKMANHATRIRNYMQRWGKEKVTEFIDYVLRIETLIDGTQGWKKKEYKDKTLQDTREYFHPTRRGVPDGHEYMDSYLNPEVEMEKKRKRIREKEAALEVGAFGKPEKDIFGFIKDNAPLKPWQQDIISMLYEESLYFFPQRMTKTANEGWASFIDSKIMADMGLISLGQKGHDFGIFEYAEHKMGVLGGKYSTNPYKLGYCLFTEIEDRWNKGKFGREWEECEDIKEKERWDKNLGLGHEKVFEVRECYNDVTLIADFFDQDFCDKYEYFEWKKYPNGETKIESRDHKPIKEKLMRRHLNGGLPDVRLTDDNHLGRGWLCLQHFSDGRMLYDSYCRESLAALYYLWKQPVVLSTKNKNGDEFIYVCSSDKSEEVSLLSRKDYDKRTEFKEDQEGV